jgi:hypothetical protein
MTDPIDPALARALDAFTVPDLPADFADRVVAAAMDLPAPATPTELPRLRQPGRRWLRRAAVGGAIVASGLFSLSAAAMGWLGEPARLGVQRVLDRVPVVAHLIERVAPHHPGPVPPTTPISAPVSKPASALIQVAPPHDQPVRAVPIVHAPIVARPIRHAPVAQPYRAEPGTAGLDHPRPVTTGIGPSAPEPLRPDHVAEPELGREREQAVARDTPARDTANERRQDEARSDHPENDRAARLARWQARRQARAERRQRMDGQQAMPGPADDRGLRATDRPQAQPGDRVARQDRPHRPDHPGRGGRGRMRRGRRG